MRIGYHLIANLHIALLHKKRARKRKGEAHLSKPCRFDVFPSQNSACIRVILKEDGRVQRKPKVNEYLGSRRIRRGDRETVVAAGHFWFQSGILLF